MAGERNKKDKPQPLDESEATRIVGGEDDEDTTSVPPDLCGNMCGCVAPPCTCVGHTHVTTLQPPGT